jgi:hypothetical protein
MELGVRCDAAELGQCRLWVPPGLRKLLISGVTWYTVLATLQGSGLLAHIAGGTINCHNLYYPCWLGPLALPT